MTKLKNKNFERLVRPNESIQVLTITNPDIPFGKHYPLGTIVSCFYEDNWWLLTLMQEVGPADTLRGVTKVEYTIDYIDNRPLGPELVDNWNFPADLSDWTIDVEGEAFIIWAEGGGADINGSGLSLTAMWQTQNLEAGANYKINVVTRGGVSGGIRIHIAGIETIYLTDTDGETYSASFTAVNGSDLYIQRSGNTDAFVLESISIKKLI